MAKTGATIPQQVVDLKLGLGLAIFRATYWNAYESEPTLGVLRSLSRETILDDANRWLDRQPEAVSELHQVAIRALEASSYGYDAAVLSYMSDTISDFPAVREMIDGSPMGYLAELVIAAIGDEENFHHLMELFLDLSV